MSSVHEEGKPLATRFELLNVHALRSALDDHNQSCLCPARAFLLNPVDHGLLGFDELWGVPVLPDPNVAVKRLRVDCEACAWQLEEELHEFLIRTEGTQ